MPFRLQALSESWGLSRRLPQRWTTRKSYENEETRSAPRHRSEDTTSSTDCVKLDYEEYLRNQRGLSERTIYHCCRLADRFLQFRFNDHSGDLSIITGDDVLFGCGSAGLGLPRLHSSRSVPDVRRQRSFDAAEQQLFGWRQRLRRRIVRRSVSKNGVLLDSAPGA